MATTGLRCRRTWRANDNRGATLRQGATTLRLSPATLRLDSAGLRLESAGLRLQSAGLRLSGHAASRPRPGCVWAPGDAAGERDRADAPSAAALAARRPRKAWCMMSGC